MSLLSRVKSAVKKATSSSSKSSSSSSRSSSSSSSSKSRIDQAKADYDSAKARGDSAGMTAAHNAADAARGYTTTADGSARASSGSSGSSSSGYKAKSDYNDQSMTSSDLQKIAQYKVAYDQAKARGDVSGMNQAHSAAESLRQGYGYRGGVDGSDYRVGVDGQPITSAPQVWDVLDTQVQEPGIMNADDLSKMYGVTYDFHTINNMLQDAVDKKYTSLDADFSKNERAFYDGMFGLQGDALNTLRKSRGSAISDGASAGVASANEMLAMLGLGDQASTLATTITQDKQLLQSKKAADQAAATTEALNSANQQGVNLANLASGFNAADTQFSVGAMDAIARVQQALADAETQKYVANSNYASNQAAAATAAKSNYSGGSGYKSSGGYNPTGGSGTVYKNNADLLANGSFEEWAIANGYSVNNAESRAFALKQWANAKAGNPATLDTVVRNNHLADNKTPSKGVTNQGYSNSRWGI